MIDDLKARLATITQANGFLFNLTEIAEGTECRSRGVAIDGNTIRCNAEGRTLDLMRTAITDVLADAYDVTDNEQDELIVAAKSAAEQPATDEGEADDATVETT